MPDVDDTKEEEEQEDVKAERTGVKAGGFNIQIAHRITEHPVELPMFGSGKVLRKELSIITVFYQWLSMLSFFKV